MKVIVVKPNREYEVTDINRGRESIEEIIDGDLEGLTFSGHTDFILFLNEIGKINGLPMNYKATMFSLEFSETVDFLFGNVIICGLDEEGVSCSLTDKQIKQFMDILNNIEES